jgi:hypothetical protein
MSAGTNEAKLDEREVELTSTQTWLPRQPAATILALRAADVRTRAKILNRRH